MYLGPEAILVCRRIRSGSGLVLLEEPPADSPGTVCPGRRIVGTPPELPLLLHNGPCLNSAPFFSRGCPLCFRPGFAGIPIFLASLFPEKEVIEPVN